MQNGQLHEIREEARSQTKAEWIRASYVAHGYETEITEKEEPPTTDP